MRSGVVPQERRELFELRFDRVALGEERLEPAIERREIGNPAPNAAQACQHRIVALVEGGVAFFAQPLDAFRTRQHLPGRGEVLVFVDVVGIQRGAIELPQLKRERVLARLSIGSRAMHTTQLRGGGLPSLICLGDRIGQRLQAAERVDDGKVRRGIEQRLVLVLAVQLDEAGRQVA